MENDVRDSLNLNHVRKRRQNRCKSCGNSTWEHFQEYSDSSTIHGTKYLGEKGRPWQERLCWIIVFLVSLYCCGVLISQLYQKWEETPVIVSFNEKSTPVWQIPMPAITICPEIKALKSKFNYTNAYRTVLDGGNLTGEDWSNFLALTAVCDMDEMEFDLGENFTTDDFAKRLYDLAPPQSYLMLWCELRSEVVNCSDLFYPTVTDIGICYTFNMLAPRVIRRLREGYHDSGSYYSHNISSENWSLEDGYRNETDWDAYPHRAIGAGQFAGLQVWLSVDFPDFDYVCRGHHQGYMVLLHSPDEAPQLFKRSFPISINQEVSVSIKPKSFTTSKNLRKYSPEKRQCYYSDERYLAFFKIYTQENCELECKTNFTLHECGCVDFSDPRKNTTKVCSGTKMQCVEHAAHKLAVSDFIDECFCLPSCSTLHYETEITESDVNWQQYMYDNRPKFDEFYNENYTFTMIDFYFKENEFVSSKRSELYGMTDFIANVGGLLGLFMGVSLLSIVEIIYFCTVRFHFNQNRNRKVSHL